MVQELGFITLIQVVLALLVVLQVAVVRAKEAAVALAPGAMALLA
jgi:hypothetical protein